MLTTRKERSDDGGYSFHITMLHGHEIGRYRHVGGRAMRWQSFISGRSGQTPYGHDGAKDALEAEVEMVERGILPRA